FGQTGPYKDRAGYDYAVQAMGGLMSVTGERDDVPGGGPQKVGVAVADLFTGLNSVIGILAALRHAERTGQGQQVDIALLDTQVSMLANLGAQYLSNGEVPKRLGNAHANIVPYQVFEVAPSTDSLSGTLQKEYIILAVGNDNQFVKFCQVAGQPDIAANPQYTKNQDRVTNRAVLVPLLATILKTRSKEDWLSSLQAVHVPCGPINNFDDVFKDPQVLARNMVTTYPHPIAGEVQLVANPLKLSATPVSTNRAPPLCGQHTEELLQELLNCSDTDVEQWRRDGVV
nr:CoA transferase [Polaromonas sp.]